jgi:hypothetical protein
VANSPEAVAAIEAIHGRGWSRGRVKMLVVGSTQVSARLPGHLVTAGWGLASWIKDQRLLTATMRAQMSLARQQALAVLGADNLVFADVELSAREQKRVGLDNAGMAATQVLQTLASEAFDRFRAANPVLLDRWSR